MSQQKDDNRRIADSACPPLDGLVVLDFSHYVSAATCAMILGDLGASVIKVERSGRGDDMRSVGSMLGEASAAFNWANRNKRGIALDLKSREGLRVALDLAARADIVIENYSTGVMDRLGLGPKTLLERNPRLIYCSISAYAREGLHAARPGFDPIAQAESGLMSVNGPVGSPGMRIGVPVVDMAAGFLATIATLGALMARARDGRGQHLEVSLFDSAVTLAALPLMSYLATGIIPQPVGSASREASPTDTFQAQDGALYITCPSDSLFERFVVKVLERPDLAVDVRFATNKARIAHSEELRAEIEAVLAQQSRVTWLARLLHAQVPAGMINDMADLVRSDEFIQRDLLSQLSHPDKQSLPCLALPFRYGRTTSAAPFRAPKHGEHTQAVLSELLGCSDDDLQELARRGAFGSPECLPPTTVSSS